MKPTTTHAHFEAERALIATLFHDENARENLFLQSGLVTREHFAVRPLGLAFAAIESLHYDGTKPELYPLIAKIELEGGKLTDPDHALLVEVCATLEPTATVEACVKLIVAKHIGRESESIAHGLGMDAAAAIDPEEIDRAIGAAQHKLSAMQEGLLGRKRTGSRGFTEFLMQSIDRLDQLQNRGDDSPVTGVPSGIALLDEATTGFHPGEVIVVGARPSMGKTSIACRISDAAARHCRVTSQGHVVYYSMEMPGLQMANRFLSMIGRIDLQALRTGKLQDGDWSRLVSATEELKSLPLSISDEVDVTPAFIRHDLRAKRRQYGAIGLVVVDYLQLMQSGLRSGLNRNDEVGAISRDLKRIALEFGCPVVALSQLNRSLETRVNKRPIMSDLRDSGGIEQDADVIMFLYRDEIYHPDSAARGGIELILGKQRNGPLATVRAAFRGEYAAIENA